MQPAFPPFSLSSSFCSQSENNKNYPSLRNGTEKSTRNRHAFECNNCDFFADPATLVPAIGLKPNTSQPVASICTASVCPSVQPIPNGIRPISNQRTHLTGSGLMTHPKPCSTGWPLVNGCCQQPDNNLPSLYAHASACDVRRLDRVQRRLEQMVKNNSTVCRPSFKTRPSPVVGATPTFHDPRNSAFSCEKTANRWHPGSVPTPAQSVSSRLSTSSSPTLANHVLPHPTTTACPSHSAAPHSTRQPVCTQRSYSPLCCDTLSSLAAASDSPITCRPSVTDACVSPIPAITTQFNLDGIPPPIPADVCGMSSTSTVPPLPHLNLRHMNVKRYPKYNTRKNSGFERRLRHTGLILDAQVTLQLLRKMLQPFVNRAVDKVVQHYMQDFIEIAVRNIRETLGEDSVTEEDLRKFRWSIMRRVALQYFKDGDLPADFSTLRSPSTNHVPMDCATSSSHASAIQHPVDSDWWQQLSSDANSPRSSSNNTAGHSPRSSSNSNHNVNRAKHVGSRELSPVSGLSPLRTTAAAAAEFKVPPNTLPQHPPQLCSSVMESHPPLLACDPEVSGSSPRSPHSTIAPHRSPSSASSGSTLGFFHSDCSEPNSPSAHDGRSGATPADKIVTRQRLRHSGTAVQSSVRHGRTRKRPLSRWHGESRALPVKSMRSTEDQPFLGSTEEETQSGSSDDGSGEPWVSVEHPIIPHTATKEALQGTSADHAPPSPVQSSHSSLRSNSSAGLELARGSLPAQLDFTSSTQFTLGSSANTWLGLGATRGRIYTKHPELFRYQCDAQDKSWLCQRRLLTGFGVKAYLMHADQVRQVGRIMLGLPTTASTAAELQTFVLPPWMLAKLRAAASMDGRCLPSGQLKAASHQRSNSPPTTDDLSAVNPDAARCSANSFKVLERNNSTTESGHRQAQDASSFKPPQAPRSSLPYPNPAVVRLIKTTGPMLPAHATSPVDSTSAVRSNPGSSPRDTSRLNPPNPPTLQRFDYG